MEPYNFIWQGAQIE
jgi:alpha-amylase